MAKSEMRDELVAALRIDKNDFDTVVLEQPELNHKVGREYALAVSKRDQTKQAIKEKHAELDAQFRSSASRNDEKMTEAQLTNKIVTAPAMKQLQAELIGADKEVNLWKSLFESFDQRYGMIQTYAKITSEVLRQNDSAGRSRTTSEAKDRLAEEARQRIKARKERERDE